MGDEKPVEEHGTQSKDLSPYDDFAELESHCLISNRNSVFKWNHSDGGLCIAYARFCPGTMFCVLRHPTWPKSRQDVILRKNLALVPIDAYAISVPRHGI